MIIYSMIAMTILSFFILHLALRIHRSYIKSKDYYNLKLVSIKENTLLFERGAEEILAVTQNFKAEKELRTFTCKKDPSKECSICDDECIFRRRDLDE